MKKIKIGAIEILGYIGIFLWVAVIFLRSVNLSSNTAYQFLLGILPNVGAAWAATMFGKWFILFVCKKTFSVKKHIILCLGVLFLALASEIIHDLFLDSTFDKYDILITVAAQLLMMFSNRLRAI